MALWNKSLLIFAIFAFSTSNGERLYTPPSFSQKSPTSSSLSPPPSSSFSYANVVAGKTPPPSPSSPSTSKSNIPLAVGSTAKPKVTVTGKPTLSTTSGPIVPVNLTFVVAARDLPVKKKGAASDPYVVISWKTATLQESKGWIPIGQTRNLKGTNNPDFLTVFTFEWTRGRNQKWHFEVKGKHSLTKDEDLGQADVTIDEYVLQKNQDINVKLSNGGNLIVKKVQPVTFQLYGRMIPKMDPLNGASDPFVECYWRIGKDGNDTLFHTTQVIEDSENPDWKEIIEFKNYQKGTNMWWHFKVNDKDSLGSNDFVGETLVEIDPYVAKRATLHKNLSTDPKIKATLTITPA